MWPLYTALQAGGLYIRVVFRAGLTVYNGVCVYIGIMYLDSDVYTGTSV